MPFKLTLNIYVTRATDSLEPLCRDMENKTESQMEKIVTDEDLEAATLSMPVLTRQSSQMSQEGKRDDAVSVRDGPSLYDLHHGRPDISGIVQSLKDDGNGQSVAVTGMSRTRSH